MYRVKFLRERREQLGLTLADMAKTLGYKESMRHRAGEWELGERKPPASRREYILRYMADTLRLRSEPDLFQAYWRQIAQEWGWADLAPSEQRDFLAALPADHASTEPLYAEAFTEQIKHLCSVAGAGVITLADSSVPSHMFVLIEERPFRRTDQTLVVCLDNASTTITEGVLRFIEETITNVLREGFATSALIVTRHSLPTPLQQRLSGPISFQTEDELVRGLINFDRHIRQIITNFEQGDTERLGRVPLAQGFVELNARVNANQAQFTQRTLIKPVIQAVNEWLEHDQQPMALVLGGYGTGKSTLALKVAYDLAVAYRDADDKRGYR
ncbi:helix-turn-helix domain-containing protein [Candidatus Viridilinea mediisalina]|uniref:Uncharacterized protein n=1 Tax=Candidatus Viridilinea mediisalina TaxID=2024553 RepID=A0A2A6RPU3_9CHLR|nr:helix-turn-helix transcriptional regulator [Candidatus Viridilinea mediisalina]PDW05037.1 hypothetical protein CJ255_00150 [Candidatus Viridilinea mediisalina]